METIKWYQSKLVWLGVIITFQGAVPVIVELLNKQVVSPADILVALSGIGTVILRVWFSTARIE